MGSQRGGHNLETQQQSVMDLKKKKKKNTKLIELMMSLRHHCLVISRLSSVKAIYFLLVTAWG